MFFSSSALPRFGSIINTEACIIEQNILGTVASSFPEPPPPELICTLRFFLFEMCVVVLFVLSVHSFCCLERIYIQTSALKELLFVRLFEFFQFNKSGERARKDARVYLLADSTNSNNVSEEEEAISSSSNNVVKNYRF